MDHRPISQSGPTDKTPSSSSSSPPSNQVPYDSPDYAPYPKLDPNDFASPAFVVGSQPPNPPPPPASNPYVSPAPLSASPSKSSRESVRDALGNFGKKVGEAAKKAEGLAGDVWQHLKTGPSVADAAMGRIAQGTKLLTEGGSEKIFQKSFDTLPEESLRKSYPCYLSTSTGPVMGVLYLSNRKLAFCSDNPLSYKVGDQTQWAYYKVVVPLQNLKTVNPSLSKINPAEKYIQVISVDNHEFWFMGFVNYDGAVKHLKEALQGGAPLLS